MAHEAHNRIKYLLFNKHKYFYNKNLYNLYNKLYLYLNPVDDIAEN